MGVYLSEPNKIKVSETGSSDYVRYAASSMQGTQFSSPPPPFSL